MAKTDDGGYRRETIEEFLARGGKVQRIPYGVRSTDEDAPKPWSRRGRPKAGAAPKPKSKRR